MKTLKIQPICQFAFKDIDKAYFIWSDLLETYEKYIEWVSIADDNFSGIGFEDEASDTIFVSNVPYFEEIWFETNGNDFEIIHWALKDKYENQDKDWDSKAEDIIEKYFDIHYVEAKGYSQWDYQGWSFVFRNPTTKKDQKKLEEIKENLEKLSKVFTASEYFFNATIETEKEDETCIKEIEDFDDLWIYNDEQRLNEDNEELQKTIEEVKKKYNVNKVEILETI